MTYPVAAAAPPPQPLPVPPAAAPAPVAAAPLVAPAPPAPPVAQPAVAAAPTVAAAPPAPPVGAPAVAPAAAPAAAPALPGAAAAPVPGVTADPMTELLTQLSQRLQAIETTLAKLAQAPGESPDEQTQRRDASNLDKQSQEQHQQHQQHTEQATAYRAQALAAAADPSHAATLEAQAVAAEQKAIECAAHATQLAANATVLRAKAFGILPLVQAMAALITDSTSKTNKLVTEVGTELKSLPKKLVTDKGGPGGAPGQGGPESAPKAECHAPDAPAAKSVEASARNMLTPEPQRRTLSASAASFVSKFGEGDEQRKTVTIAQFEAAAATAQLSITQRIAMKVELANQGLLAG